MSTFIYGPPANGAGVRVIRRDTSVPATAGQLGSSLIVGAFPKGPIGRPVKHSGASHYARVRTQDIFVEDQTPLMALHWYEAAGKSAGALATFRIADGDQAAASLKLFDRNVDTTIRALTHDARVNAEVGSLAAASAGTWAGNALTYGGSVANGGAAISGSTFATGLTTFKLDELKGANIYFDGWTTPFEITTNSAAGVITVAGDLTVMGIGAVALAWKVVRESVDDKGRERGLQVVVRDGQQQPDGKFGVVVMENGSEYNNPWSDLSLSDTDRAHWQKVIDEALARENQWEVDADDQFSGDPTDAKLKPANWAEVPYPAGVSDNTIKLNLMRYRRTGTGTGYIARSSFRIGDDVVPHIMTLTFTNATTYTVAVTDFEGRTIATGLSNGTVGVAYAVAHSHLSGHTVTAGATPHVAGDTIAIYCRALPSDIANRGGWFYPYAFAGTAGGGHTVTERYRITAVQNNADGSQTITLGVNDDLDGVAVPPGLPQVGGKTAGTYDMTVAKTVKGELYIDGVISGVAFNVTLVGGTAADSATVVRDAINAALVLAGEARVEAFVQTTLGVDCVGLRATATWGNYGPEASLKITDGTINAVIGIVNDTEGDGEEPTVCRIEYAQQVRGGLDGHHGIADADVTAALDPDTSRVQNLLNFDLGVVKFITPGESSATVQAAAKVLAQRNAWAYYGEITAATASESAAAKFLRDTVDPGEHEWWTFPTYGDLESNPFGGSTAYEACALG